ncbi:PREDICTED: uncharacterized protein LOC108663632 [Theobroma cacao]|uniref:Uncharacterized protein LOC108663632 n=1 Tax=Theobroma cacao TaxID=3641 RepID=A0AB32X2T2_THECC|nr:PREDICTED: uncharacterized protein LOC108663632 [Theobroma cacao]
MAINLKSGKKVDNSVKQATFQDKPVENETMIKTANKQIREREAKTTLPSPPFPQHLQKQKLDKHFQNFLKEFKKLHINIPFAKALEQMPSYVKFLKDILTKKRKLEDFETITFTEECAGVSIMPLSVAKRIRLKEIQPTTNTLQLADRTIRHLYGVIEDFLLKVKKLFIPIDFIVLEMEEDQEVSIILGHLFLATVAH